MSKIANNEKKNPKNIVRADIPGFKKPKPIGKKKRIIDVSVEGRNGNLKKLIEVETTKSDKRDKDQQSTFKKSAAQRGGIYIRKTIKTTDTKKPAVKKSSPKKSTFIEVIR